MPIHSGQDKAGTFYQWGSTGKKYYYEAGNEDSRKRALNKAKKQQTAIYSSGWKGDAMKLIRVKKKVDKFDPSLAEKKEEWFDFKKKEVWDKIRSKYLSPLFQQESGEKFIAKVDIVNGPTLDFEEARELANDILKACNILSKASIETKKQFPDMKR